MSFPVISRGRLWYVPDRTTEPATRIGFWIPSAFDLEGRRQLQNGQRGDPHQGERGAGPDHRFYRGDRLLPEYRSRYVVDDWRGHQAGGIATGVILQLLLNH
jgi:hypothetical protein